ncbi:MAG: DUF2062 domain-containing protein [Chitinispirillaceae bacterium]|nr:DUF2062 domain-containing protein [Chitinispirillaceae bacterium]
MNPAARQLSHTLLGLSDSTHRIALGAGLGLFLGVLPGTGAIAALVMAFLLHANKAAALAGALAVNTWINIVAFPLALAVGAQVSGMEPSHIAGEWTAATSPFAWSTFLAFVLRHALLALISGYALIGLVMGCIGYAVVYFMVRNVRGSHGSRRS